MLYRPDVPRAMWGMWAIEWEGTYHIFYLEDVNADYDLLSWQKNNDHIGHAVSTDLIHWESRPSLCVRGEPGTWNEMPPGQGAARSGMVVRHAGEFYLFVGAQREGVQMIGVWTSPDLDHWTPHPANPVLQPGSHYYPEDMKAVQNVGWRDPHIVYREEDGHYHGVLCACIMRSPDADDNVRWQNVVGHVRSKNLINWEYLPPITTSDILLIGNDVGARNTGQIEPRNRAASTSRVLPYGQDQVLLHFVKARRPVQGTPKLLQARADGTLYLEYMPVLEKLETDVLCESVAELPISDSPDSGTWHVTDGGLSGVALNTGSVCRVVQESSDLHVACTVIGRSVDRAGVALRINAEGGWPGAVAVVLDYEQQRVFIGGGEKYPRTGWYCHPLDVCRMPLAHDKPYHLRCFARDEHFEVYLDKQWIFTAVIPEASKDGAVELMIENGEAVFSSVRVASIRPLD